MYTYMYMVAFTRSDLVLRVDNLQPRAADFTIIYSTIAITDYSIGVPPFYGCSPWL